MYGRGRRLALVPATLLLLGVLAACSGATSSPTAPGTAPSVEPAISPGSTTAAALAPSSSPFAAASVAASTAQLFNITPRPRTPSPTPEIVPPGVTRTVAAGPSPPPGGVLNVALSLSEQVCSGGAITLYAAVSSSAGKPVRGVTLTGQVALKEGSRDLRFAPTDASGKSSATLDLGHPRGAYYIVWMVQAQAGAAAGAGSMYCQTPA